MATQAQKESRKRNFAIFRLRGVRATLTTISVQFGLNEAYEGVQLCGRMIMKLKEKGRT